jgi:hypothetical protein
MHTLSRTRPAQYTLPHPPNGARALVQLHLHHVPWSQRVGEGQPLPAAGTAAAATTTATTTATATAAATATTTAAATTATAAVATTTAALPGAGQGPRVWHSSQVVPCQVEAPSADDPERKAAVQRRRGRGHATRHRHTVNPQGNHRGPAAHGVAGMGSDKARGPHTVTLHRLGNGAGGREGTVT